MKKSFAVDGILSMHRLSSAKEADDIARVHPELFAFVVKVLEQP